MARSEDIVSRASAATISGVNRAGGVLRVALISCDSAFESGRTARG
jgi:hypothetical protein